MLHISCRITAGHHMQTPISLYHYAAQLWMCVQVAPWLHCSVYERTCMRRSHTLSGVLCSGQPGPRRTHKGCHCLQQGTGNRLCLDYCACVCLCVCVIEEPRDTGVTELATSATQWYRGAGVLPVNLVSSLWFFKTNKHHLKEIINLGFYHLEGYCDSQTVI